MTPDLQVRFRFGEAFPSTDALSKWVVAVAWVRNDLAEAHHMMENVGDNSVRRMYYFRLAAAHFREAVKMLDDSDQRPEVKTFIDSLSVEAKGEYAKALSICRPWEGSFLKDVVVPIRNACFHYPIDKSSIATLEAAMLEVGPQTTGISVGASGSWRAVFADEVALQSAFPGYDEDRFIAVISTLREGVTAVIRFVDAAIQAYLANLPKGVVSVNTCTPQLLFAADEDE